MKKFDHSNVHTPLEEHISLVKQQKIWISEALSECHNDILLAKKYKKISYSPQKQHIIISSQQHKWSIDAKRDADYNYKQYMRFYNDGRHILAEGYKKEYEWSMIWYDIRRQIYELHKILSITDNKDKFVLYNNYIQEHHLCKMWVKRRIKLLKYHQEMIKKLNKKS